MAAAWIKVSPNKLQTFHNTTESKRMITKSFPSERKEARKEAKRD
jgi:hypothetical protein